MQSGKTMSRFLITLLLALVLAAPLWAQEDTGDVEEPAAAEVAESGESGEPATVGGAAEAVEPAEGDEADAEEETTLIVDPEFDNEALDEQTYEEDDDDFVPSEEIPADEPIPFPSNI